MILVPPVALAVSPPRLVLAVGETRAIDVTNRGAAVATIVASPAGLVVGLRGRPAASRAPSFVVVRPRKLTVAPGATAVLEVAAAARRLAPGDHASLVLVASRPSSGSVGVSVRIGVVVVVRGAGKARERVVPVALRARGRYLELALRNEGNVCERVTDATMRVRLLPRGAVRIEPRELLPHTRGLVRLETRRRSVAGAIVRVGGRTFRVKLAGRR